MSNLLINSLKPFTEFPNALPKQYYLNAEINGRIEKTPDGCRKVQFIPSDAPSMMTVNEYKEQANTIDYDIDEMLYTINKQGWRAPQFRKEEGKDAIMFLGDSYTFGIGVRDNEVFPHLVAEQLGKINWNLGCGGICNKTMLYILEHFLEDGYIPSLIVANWGEMHRKLLMLSDRYSNKSIIGWKPDITSEIFSDGSLRLPFENYDVWSPVWQEKFAGNIDKTVAGKAWALTYNNEMYIEFYNTRRSFRKTCQLYNIPYIETFQNQQDAYFGHNMDGGEITHDIHVWGKYFVGHNPEFMQKTYGPSEEGRWGEINLSAKEGGSWGRDNLHWGKLKHEMVADKVITLLNQAK